MKTSVTAIICIAMAVVTFAGFRPWLAQRDTAALWGFASITLWEFTLALLFIWLTKGN